MSQSINPYLMPVNHDFIHGAASVAYNQPMVNAFIATLLREKDLRGLSWAAVGDLAGVSAQAAHKWSKGGNIADEQLEKLAEAWGMTPLELKYGVSDTSSRPPIIEAGEWNSLSVKRREFIERVALSDISDGLIDVLEAVISQAVPAAAVPAAAMPAAAKPPVVKKRTVSVTDRRTRQTDNLPFADRRKKHGQG